MKYNPPNSKRGQVAAISLVLIFISGIQYGLGISLTIIGILLYIDCVIDNAVERFTDTTNWK